MRNSVRATNRGWARAFAGSCALGFAMAAAAQSPSHAPDPLFHDGYEGIAAGPYTDSDAARFLAQATFGPTDADIAHLRSLTVSHGGAGYQAWLNEQFVAAPTHEMTYLNWISAVPMNEQIGQDNRIEAWLLGALGGPDPANNLLIHSDQLRQRVAFALSQILVVSDQNTELGLNGAAGMAYYYDILADNAFGNYRTLLEKVTLSPAMGVYLNMLGNRRADLANNVHPDENYGREINQLFSVGLVMLNADGTQQLAGGQPIPTYTQSTITNFAHVLTGWNWASCDTGGTDNFVGCYTPYGTPSDYLKPMVAYESAPSSGATCVTSDCNYHDNGTHADDLTSKQLLAYTGAASGGIVPNGHSAYQDLTFALDNIYNHPNVAPFVSKQLIQRLVTSNPSPAYVQRVAAVFNSNRSSATQLQTVVQAILLDPEARYGQWHSQDTFGKLREPLLTLTHFWRAMHAVHHCGLNIAASGSSAATNYANQPYRYAGYSTAWNTSDTQYGAGVAQAPLDAFTVFNFFKPSFMPPGEMTTLGLRGPEFQLQTDSIIANSTNAIRYYAYLYDLADACGATDTFGDVKIDHTQDANLAGSVSGGPTDPADRLVDAYNHRFMSGQMSPFMRQTLLDYLNSIDSTWGTDWQTQRIDRALYLILTSPEYMIQK